MTAYIVPDEKEKELFDQLCLLANGSTEKVLIDPERIKMFNRITEQRARNQISYQEALKAIIQNDCYLSPRGLNVYYHFSLTYCLTNLDLLFEDLELRLEVEQELKKKLTHAATA